MSHSGLLYLFWEQDFGRSNRPISKKMNFFIFLVICYIFSIIIFIFIKIKENIIINKTSLFKLYRIYFLISFILIFLYRSKEWSILKTILYFRDENNMFHFYISDYNRFIKEFYNIIFFYIFSVYLPFIIILTVYKLMYSFPNYKGIIYCIYLFFITYFLAFFLSQNQTILDINLFIESNNKFLKNNSIFNFTIILFNNKGYFFDIFIIIFFWNFFCYVILFCIRIKYKVRNFIKKKNEYVTILWIIRLLIYLIYIYFISAFIYLSFIYFCISIILFVEYLLFFIRFRSYLKGRVIYHF